MIAMVCFMRYSKRHLNKRTLRSLGNPIRSGFVAKNDNLHHFCALQIEKMRKNAEIDCKTGLIVAQPLDLRDLKCRVD